MTDPKRPFIFEALDTIDPREYGKAVTGLLTVMLQRTVNALRDLAPIIIVIAFFQIVVLRQPFPNLGNVLVGLLCVVAGLTLFIQGLESGLFPLVRHWRRASRARAV